MLRQPWLTLCSLCACCLGAGPPSELDQSGRTQPPLLITDQPLGDIGQWYILDIIETRSAAGATLTKLEDGSILVSGHDPDHDTFTVIVRTTLQNIRAIRMDVLADESLPRDGPGRSSGGNFTLSSFELTAAPANEPQAAVPVALSRPEADYSQREYDVTLAFDGAADSGWSIGTGGSDHHMIVHCDPPLGASEATILTFTLRFDHPKRRGYTLGKFRLSATTVDPSPPAVHEPVFQPLLVSVGFVSLPITEFASAQGASATAHSSGDHSIVITGGKPSADIYTLELQTDLQSLTGLRLDFPGDDPAGLAAAAQPALNFAIGELVVHAAPRDDPQQRRPVALVYPTTNAPRGRQPIDQIVDGNDRSLWVVQGRPGQSYAASFAFSSAIGHESGTILTVTLRQRLPVQRLRVLVTTAREHRFIEVASPETVRPAAPPPPPPAPRVERYYNLAGHAYADPQGRQWLPARRWRDGQDGYTGGASFGLETSPDPLLRDGLSGIDSFRVYVPDGRYRVGLVFAEVRGHAVAGYRRFNVFVENVLVIRNLDLVMETGEIGRPYVYVLPAVPVKDGVLDLEFTGEKPILNALVVISADAP